MNNQEIEEKVSALKSIILKGIVGVGAALVIFAGYTAYQSHLSSKNSEAAEVFYQAHQMESQQNKDDPNAAFDVKLVMSWDATKLDSYMKILKKIDEEYSGTPTWALSQIRLGKIYAAQGKFAEAQKAFENVMNAGLNSALFYGIAADALGVILEDAGKKDEALKVFEAASENSDNPLRPLALLGKARVLESLGKPGADKVYDEVVKQFPETTYSRRAAVLRSMLGQGSAGAR